MKKVKNTDFKNNETSNDYKTFDELANLSL